MIQISEREEILMVKRAFNVSVANHILLGTHIPTGLFDNTFTFSHRR